MKATAAGNVSTVVSPTRRAPGMHIVVDTEQPGAIRGELAEFQAFTSDIASHCDEPPVVTSIERQP
jgi:hypothetical protein